MPRGGARPGAGGRYKWLHGETKVVRVPIALADQILEIAKILDQGGSLDDVTRSKKLDLSGVPIRYLNDGPVVSIKDLLKSGYIVRPVALADQVRKRMDKEVRSK